MKPLLAKAGILVTPSAKLFDFIDAGPLVFSGDLADAFKHLFAGGLDGDNDFVGLFANGPIELSTREKAQLVGDFGGDALDTFWPVRNDYIEKEVKQKALLDQVVAPDAKPPKDPLLSPAPTAP